METIQRKNRFVIGCLLLFLASSCSSDTIFTKYKSMPSSSWDINNKVPFNFHIKDTLSKRNVYINLRNNNAYKYSNLYVITELVFPNKTIVIDTLQYKMTGLSGAFLGSGFSEIKENKLFYKEEKVFPISGDYIFNIRQAMRNNGASTGIKALEGITDIGFSIEKTQ